MDILEKIFGGAAKVKIMRLFLFNPGVNFNIRTITLRTKIRPNKARPELKILEDICLIKRKRQKGVVVWILNENFSYLKTLQNFLIHTSPLQDSDLVRRLSRVGKIKMLIVSGVFIQEKDSRVDLLVVGDNLKKGGVERVIKGIEAEIGKELMYASFETPDFQYRLGMYDKLVRDILDYPHRKLINKLGLVAETTIPVIHKSTPV